MTEKEAQGNPNSPAGWAVQEVVNPDAHPNGELLALEEQKRNDTAAWEDSQNRSPMDNENPAQPAGWAVPPASEGPIPGQGADALKAASIEVVARVFADRSARTVVGGKVLIGTSEEDHVLGEVIAVNSAGDKFWTAWRDGQDSIEETKDYELIIRQDGE